MLEKPFDEVCPVRQQVAKDLLATPNCCLEYVDQDLALKAKQEFHRDFVHAERTGLLTEPLRCFLLTLRSVLSLDTQDLEGINSLIQVMCSRAPSMRLPLLNARVSIKKYKPSCPGMHRFRWEGRGGHE